MTKIKHLSLTGKNLLILLYYRTKKYCTCTLLETNQTIPVLGPTIPVSGPKPTDLCWDQNLPYRSGTLPFLCWGDCIWSGIKAYRTCAGTKVFWKYVRHNQVGRRTCGTKISWMSVPLYSWKWTFPTTTMTVGLSVGLSVIISSFTSCAPIGALVIHH